MVRAVTFASVFALGSYALISTTLISLLIIWKANPIGIGFMALVILIGMIGLCKTVIDAINT